MTSPPSPRWLHFLALGTVCAALPLIFLGAEVTTMAAGMADSRPVVSPWQAIGEFFQGRQNLGWAVEHSHRLFGWFVGLGAVALAAGAWFGAKHLEVKVAATAALVLIGVQGLLGIFRIHLHVPVGPNLALVHGCFAQIVFATLVTVALFTSANWPWQAGSRSTPALRRWSLVCALGVFAQLVLGGLVRHQNTLAAGRLHLLGAFVVLAGLLVLVKLTLEEPAIYTRARRVLLALLVLQILLGVEAWLGWMARFLDPGLAGGETTAQHLVRSGHYVIGALVLATTVAIAWKAHRGWSWWPRPAAAVPAGSWEGAA